MKRRLSILFVLLAAVLFSGCAEHQVPPISRPDGVYAVAGMTHPKYNWQLMAGYLPMEGKEVEREVLFELDQTMMQLLASHGVNGLTPPANTRQCQEIITFENKGASRITARQYWVNVGKCMKVDYLIVPQLLYWKERQGSEWGVENPAGVVMDLYIVDVKNESLLARRHFDETQRDLSSDLGNAGKFVDRGGKWITASELAREGLEKMLLELGL
ncbi:MAG: hypothetical protein V3573_07315 [Desulfovibrionaceae bacterium]